MSSLTIQMLMHFFSIKTPFINEEMPAQQEIIALFLRHDVIVVNAEQECYETTEKGNAWVESILAVPIPIKKIIWVNPGEE